MAWQYQKDIFPDKAAVLAEVERLIDGTPAQSPQGAIAVHFIVDTDSNLVVGMNIGGKDAEANFARILKLAP